MSSNLIGLADRIDRPIAVIGRTVMWASLAVVLLQLVALAVLWFAPGLATRLPHRLYGL